MFLASRSAPPSALPETPSAAAPEAIAVMLKLPLAEAEAVGTACDCERLELALEATADELLCDCAFWEAELINLKPEGTGTVVYTLDTWLCV